MEYSVGDLVKYHGSTLYIGKVTKVAYGYAWWCLDDEETSPTRYHTKVEQFIQIESINCEWSNKCIANSNSIEPYTILTKKNIKKHEWT